MKTILNLLILFLVAFSIHAQQRTPLFEVLTSSTCPPCNQGNKDLQKVLNQSDGNWTCVKYQMYFPGVGDPYFTEEGYTRARYYDLTGVPTLRVDGTTELYPGALTNQMVEDHQDVPAKTQIYASYWQDANKIVIDVEVQPTQNVLTPFLKLFVAVVENKTFNNVATNGETEFEFVMKKMFPDGSGQSLSPLKVDQPQAFEFIYEFNGDYRLPNDSSDPINHEIEHSIEEFDDLAVVVWVQNRNTQEMLQSTWATFLTNTDEVDEKGNGIIALFPNPVKDVVHLHYLLKTSENCKLSISNINGAQVLSRDIGNKNPGNSIESLDLSGLPVGQYILSLVTGNQIHTKTIHKVE